MRMTIKIPQRNIFSWLAFLSVAVTTYAYFTVTSIPMITYILLGTILLNTLDKRIFNTIAGTRFFIYTCFLIVYVLVISLIAKNVQTGMTEAILYQMIVGLCFYMYAINEQKGIDHIITFICLSVLIFSIIILMDDKLMTTLQRAKQGNVYYTYGDNNRNTIAIILSVGALCMMHLGVEKKRIWYLCMILAVALGLFTGSRKAVLIMLAGAVGYIIMYSLFVRKQASNKWIVVFFLVLAMVGMVYACFEIPVLYQIIGVRIEGFFGVLTGRGTTERSAEIRSNMVRKALEMFARKPLFGWGIEGFAKYSGFSVYSHNNYTETLVSFGILGFVLFYGLKIKLLINQFRVIKRQKDVTKIPTSLLCFVLMAVMLAVDMAAVSMNSVVINLPFALAAADQYRNRETGSEDDENSVHSQPNQNRWRR